MSLEVIAVHKSFGNMKALENVDLKVGQGELFTLLGPSGCGKTTLLRIIAGLEAEDSGSILLNNQPLSRVPANRRPINTVFQSYALFPHMTSADNIAFGLRSRKTPETEVQTRVAAVMEMMELTQFAGRYPDQLSGGQKQRVALARALVNEPELLLLDEPMSALDAKLRAQLQIQLRQLQRKIEKTFILVTHDQDEALTVSDRIAIMNAGKVVQSGTPQEIYERPANRFVASFIGIANILPALRNGVGLHTPVGVMTMPKLPDWTEGALVIRPEGVLPRAEMPARNGVQARVTEIYYRGNYLDVVLEPGPLRMRTAPHRRLAPGDTLWVELLEDALVAIDD